MPSISPNTRKWDTPPTAGLPPKRVSAQGYKGCFISENVWSSFRHSETMLAEELARKAMDGWKKSPGHNANLVQKRAHEIGIGAAGWKLDGGEEIFRVVQVFATVCDGMPWEAAVQPLDC